MDAQISTIKRAIAALPGAAEVLFSRPLERVGELRLTASGFDGVDISLLLQATRGCRVILRNDGSASARLDIYVPTQSGVFLGRVLVFLGTVSSTIGVAFLLY